MKKNSKLDPLAPRPTLDFSKGVRGKHYLRTQASNVVSIDSDLLEVFPDSQSVNNALRSLKIIAERSTKRPARRASLKSRELAAAK